MSTGQGFIGFNMFAYCRNNPARYVDYAGNICEEACEQDSEDESKPRIVGAGIQINIDAGCASFGFEIILYWDPTVCGEGNWVIAIYSYGGISMETYDAWIGSIVAIITDNADLLMTDAEKNVSKIQLLIAAYIGNGFSFSLSGLAIVGNDNFTSVESYEKSFTSINVGIRKARASYAYSDTGFAISLGGSIVGGI